MEKRYLQTVKIILEEEDSNIRKEAECLAEKLTGEGLETRLYAKAEAKGWWDRKDLVEREMDQPVLYLTDSEEAARCLTEWEAPIIVWLHEGNRSGRFGQIRYAAEDAQELDACFFDRIYRRYRQIPWVIAETERCLIRETVPEDADCFAQMYADPEMTRYTEGFCREPDTEQETIKAYIRKFYEFYGYGVWTVLWKESGEVIGRVGFEQPQAPTLGYAIAAKWQGKGLATEVGRAALQVAEEELFFEEVRAEVHRENQASLQVIRKLGFVKCTEEDSAKEDSTEDDSTKENDTKENDTKENGIDEKDGGEITYWKRIFGALDFAKGV